MVIASFMVAVVAVVIALASVRYTRAQAMEARKATTIEQKRWHADRTPELAVTCGRDQGDSVDVTVELTGPASLDRLDEVMVRVRDDIPGRKPGMGSQLTEQQISEVIWGPYRIRPGLAKTERNGRSHGPFALLKHEPYPIPMERTVAPSWNGSRWREQYEDKPIRLEFTCVREGDDPWVLQTEVRPGARARIRILDA